MSTIQEFIHSHQSKKLQITLSGKTDNLHIIDWKTISETHEEVMEQIEEMEEDEAGEFLSDNETELIQITEYFMNDACDEKVEDDKWLPIGLLGLSHHPDSFAETGNNGLLLLDLTKETNNTYPVILFKDGKKQVVANSLQDLTIQEV